MSDQHRYDYLETVEDAPYGTQYSQLAAVGRSRREFSKLHSQCPSLCPITNCTCIRTATLSTGAVDNGSFLPATVPTYYQQLRDHGYRVGCVGKLDLAKPDGYNGRYGDRPRTYSWGFTHPEECEGKMHAGSSPTPIGPYTHYLQEKGCSRRSTKIIGNGAVAAGLKTALTILSSQRRISPILTSADVRRNLLKPFLTISHGTCS